MLQEASMQVRRSLVVVLALLMLLFVGMVIASPAMSPLTGIASAQENDNGDDDNGDDDNGDDDADDGEAPVGGVETGFGGAVAAGTAVPALVIGGSALIAGGAATVARRRRR